jgi:molecular chaperone GrpE
MSNPISNSPSDRVDAPPADAVLIPQHLLQIEAAPIDVPQNTLNLDIKAAYEGQLLAFNALEREHKDFQRTTIENQRKLLSSMLDVVDALDRLLAFTARSGDPATVAGKTLVDGLESTRRIILRNLGKVGVARMSTLGKVPDTEFCAIDDERDDENAEPGTVVEELIVGYTLNGKVLRTAVVVVAAER